MSGQLKKVVQGLPVNYPVGVVFLNGLPVEVSQFINLNPETGLAYFLNAEGQTTVLDTAKIDGLSFGVAEGPEEE
ncbi:hypothetical protein [Peribacillus simplex]|uniref:hypothetical protein n=1 Tax=Peribacillus simplex TaxID=1478 RepID=UPI0011A29EF0|nr:hypothetical protein [Peribacillus simplex]